MQTIVTVCRSVTLLNPAKMAELIEMPFGLNGYSSVICLITAEPTEMPFGLLALMGPRNHVLDGVQMP